MATIHINRGGTNLGTFSEDDVRAGLRAGRFLGSDLGWREGMAAWQPLSQFAEFVADPSGPTATPAAPLPASTPSSPDGTPAVTPSPAAPPVSQALAPLSGLPWDRRGELGLLKAFIETLQMVLTRPTEAFTAMKREGGFGEPLIYGLIGGCSGYIVYILFMFMMPSLAMLGGSREAVTGFVGMGFGIAISIVFIPVGVTILLFVAAGILHVCLMIVGGAKQGFETTFRVVCFAIGSAYPLMIVPFCGGITAAIWTLVLKCIGLARAHETDTGRAVLAVFLPLVLCCGCGVLAAFLIPALTHHVH